MPVYEQVIADNFQVCRPGDAEGIVRKEFNRINSGWNTVL
jgi:hypothetical protein